LNNAEIEEKKKLVLFLITPMSMGIYVWLMMVSGFWRHIPFRCLIICSCAYTITFTSNQNHPN